jgi:hypothetical protein
MQKVVEGNSIKFDREGLIQDGEIVRVEVDTILKLALRRHYLNERRLRGDASGRVGSRIGSLGGEALLRAVLRNAQALRSGVRYARLEIGLADLVTIVSRDRVALIGVRGQNQRKRRCQTEAHDLEALSDDARSLSRLFLRDLSYQYYRRKSISVKRPFARFSLFMRMGVLPITLK